MEISIILPLVLFICFGCFLLFMMRRMVYDGGWQSLRSKYKTQKQAKEINAKPLKINSINIEGTDSQNLIKFYETEEGLFLTLTRILGKHDYNILIPWEEIVEIRKRKTFYSKTIRLIIGQPFVTFIDLREKDFKKIEKYLLKE